MTPGGAEGGFKDKHLAGGYLAINKSTLEKLPMAESSVIYPFSILSKILHLKRNQIDEETYTTNKLVLDSIVLELFFSDHMKERGIDVLEFVEQDIEEIMEDEVFENLEDTAKQKVIEQLYTKWTDPDNEVCNRIKLFTVRSPDILKPILESK